MQNKYIGVAPVAPQMAGPMQMNQHAMMRQNMQCLAWGQPAKPEPVVVKKSSVKDCVKKWAPVVATAGFLGYVEYKKRNETPSA